MLKNNTFPTNLSIDPIYPRIKVIGLGGAGCNTINRLSRMKMPGIELIAANTDSQALSQCQADHKLLLGKNLTGGFGAGGNPETGKKAAEESYRELIHTIKKADFLFLTAGMGGGTGSGAIQIAARMAKSLDISAIGMVTLPFSFESSLRFRCAVETTSCLQPLLDTLITIPNDRLLTLCTHETRLDTALAFADDILIQAILGITGLINNQGQLDIDLSHILRLMKIKGGTYISTANASGNNKVINAIQKALQHPLLDGLSIQDAKGIILKMTGDVAISEINQAIEFLQSQTSAETEIIPAVHENRLPPNQVKVLLLATGIGAQPVSIHLPDETNPSRVKRDVIEDFNNTQVKPVENKIGQDSEDLLVPAFIRRGYNLINSGNF